MAPPLSRTAVDFGPDPAEDEMPPAARAALADYTALYIGGMGSREQNFYNALARRMGFDEAACAVHILEKSR